MGVHGLDHLLGEQTRLAGYPDQNIGFAVLHHFQQRNILAGHGPVLQVFQRLGQRTLKVDQIGHVVGDQTKTVHHEHPLARLGVAQAFGLHLGHDLLGDTTTGGAGAEESHFLLGQLAAAGLTGRNQGAQRHGGGALNVIVEAAQLVLVTVEHRHGVFLGKVFKLQQHLGPAALHRLNEGIHKLLVFFTGDPRVAPAHVHGIFQQLRIVGTRIQYYRQGVGRRNTATGGVQGQFADGNAHAADALVAQTQNTFTVGDHDNLDVLLGGVLQYVVDTIPVRVGNEQTPGATVDVGKLFTGLTHGRGIDDGHHLAQVILHQTVEQGLVGVLNVAQINMLVEIVLKGGVLFICPRRLLFDGFDIVGQQAFQVERNTLFLGKSTAFVQQRGFQQGRACIGYIKGTFFMMLLGHKTSRLVIVPMGKL